MSPFQSDGSVRKDGELMRRIAAGDTGALRQIMDVQAPRLTRLALGIVGRLDEAEDVAQETLLALWNAAPQWQEKSTVGAFLRTVATRKSIDLLRKRQSQVEDFEFDRLLDPGQGPEAELEKREDLARLAEMMAALPENQRTALVLAHFEGLSHAEAAETMELGVDAYSSLLARARRALRQKFEGAEMEKGGDDDHG
ncbi:RNA polymerase sigma factor [Hoeflea poritis]|uniref:Sigma-70 family RNA polymerase sigma factor n=1 Tax=Hoeflea poritis TaxID=2993659 RepID=A0ABT4VHE0_9HYPH|nr:sigma-70 family RNA polymerase sigma factor [Hoeflea poritis]MDA4844121.1 sigma-70 family RNA polymerase sigma factor [Hoeflea poritis]